MNNKEECIFIVDDESPNLRLLSKLLANQGYTNVVEIQDPRQVLPYYREHQPSLILLDINMPNLDGFQVMEQLRGLDDPLSPPIVVLTARRGRDYLLKALKAGARDYLTKPFDIYELQMRVRNLLDAHRAHQMDYDQKKTLEREVRERTKELQQTRLQVVQRLGMAAEYRDEETGNHILRMSYISHLLAKLKGWGDAECDLILNASPMHDIGKIGIPDNILLKPGKLLPDEWEVMKTHTTIGHQLLNMDDSSLMCMASEIALTHHEKWDGSGYPNGLSGSEIPDAGRIAALADVFDALTSERPYKKAWSVEKAKEFIWQQRGKHFDPELVGIFMDNFSEVMKIKSRFDD